MQFKKRKKMVQIPIHARATGEAASPQLSPLVSDGLWERCPACRKVVAAEDWAENLRVCPHCNHHQRLTAHQRIGQVADEDTFQPFEPNLRGGNPLDFPGYPEKLKAARTDTGLSDAVMAGECQIGGERAILCSMDGRFMMGSMGAAVGEKLTRAMELATERKLPIIIFTVSGGARMQEGLISLMQMAKVSAAVSRHNEAGLLYISVLTDPTTGGVTASFASLGDLILAEPGALIGFAGRRVIEQTIKQQLPDDFQRAEFLMQKGFIDRIVSRDKMASTLATLLKLHAPANVEGGCPNE